MSSSSGSGGSQDIDTEEEEETLEQQQQPPLPSEAKYKVSAVELSTDLREFSQSPEKDPNDKPPLHL